MPSWTRRFLVAMAATVSLAQVPSPASAGAARITFKAVVPLKCHAKLLQHSQSIEDSVVNLGEIQTYCNSPRGFRIFADHPAAAIEGDFVIEEKRIPIGENGRTLLWEWHDFVDTRYTLQFVPRASTAAATFPLQVLVEVR